MAGFAFRMTVVLLLASTFSAQTQTAPGRKAPAKPAAARQSPGAIAGSPAQQVALEQTHLRDVVLSGNIDALRNMLASGAVVTLPTGVTLDEVQVLTALKNQVQLERLEMSDVQVRPFGDAAVVTGRIDATGQAHGRELRAAYRFTQVWQRQGSEWKTIAFQAMPLGDAKP